jgi:hypothetical protein
MEEKKERYFTAGETYLMNGERQIIKNIGGLQIKNGVRT